MSTQDKTPAQTFELKDVSGSRGVTREVKGTVSIPVERPTPAPIMDRSRI